MAVNTLFILNSTTHGVPSGNYDGSSLAFDSNAQKGVGYYQGQGNMQTIGIRVSAFDGKITMQATLDELDNEFTNWFDIYTYDQTAAPITDYHPVTVTGNFTWIRARVTAFEAGTIDDITVSY